MPPRAGRKLNCACSAWLWEPGRDPGEGTSATAIKNGRGRGRAATIQIVQWFFMI